MTTHDPAQTKDSSIGGEGFREYRVASTRRLTRRLLPFLLVVMIVMWPTDLLVFSDEPDTLMRFAILRVFLGMTLVAAIAALRWVEWARQHPGELFFIVATIYAGFCGWGIAPLGGLEKPWYYAVYVVAALAAPALLPIGRRIVLSFAASVAWSIGFFGCVPEHLEAAEAPAVLLFQLFTILAAITVGHWIYRMSLRDYLAQRTIRQTFGRYFSEDVADAVLLSHDSAAAAGGEEREITVLFSDIANYSTLTERLPPKQVLELLNRYFGAMQGIIEAHQGTVLEYLGDAILVVFGAPRDLADHPAHAVRCAREMRAMLVALNHDWEEAGLAHLWRDQGIESLEIRIGIHTGTVVAGNIGSPSYMKYGVVGDAVNVAARLESLNKELDTVILASGAVYERLPDALRSGARRKGSFRLKGRQDETSVYAV